MSARPLRPARRVLTLLGAVSLLAGFAGSVTPAQADPLASARARAAALAAAVNRLQTKAEVATEAYDKAEAQLAVAVTDQELAQRQAEADQQVADAAALAVGDRVRALYESGGQATLLATVLEGSDPVDALARLHTLGSVLSYDSSGVAAARTASNAAQAIANRLAATAARVTRLQVAAATEASRVRTLLQAQRAALQQATAEVRQLVTQQQAAAAAASAASFAAAVRDAGGTLDGGTTPPNAIAAGAIAAARSRLGVPYVWGATGPDSFDCSGLTQWSYAHVGITLPRVAADQWNAGPHIPLNQLEPGDLLFWATDVNDPVTIHHVAIYIGNGLMIAAPHTGDVVKVEPVYLDGYIGATRPYATAG